MSTTQRLEDDAGETLVNSFPACHCRRRRCRCSGGNHSYAADYERILQAVRPKLVVEWGPGLNTKLALALPECRVFAIEDNPHWAPRPADARFQCRICHVNSAAYLELAELAKADLFFVDGRRRAECLSAIADQARPSAIVALHDAQRRRYHRALATFPHVKFMQRGFAVASRQPLPV